MAEQGRIAVFFTSNTVGFKRGVKEVQQGVKDTDKGLNKFKDSVKSIAPMIGAAFAVGAVVRFGKAMSVLAIDTEFAFKKIETLVGLSREQVQGMEKDVRSLSAGTGRDVKELADALFVVTSAGVRGAEAMNVLERSAQAARIGLGETKDIARATTAILQAYGVENISAAEATDIFVATVREGNLEASSLAPAIGRVLPLASQLGVSFAEVGANIATFTRLGIPTEEAIVGLRGVMSALIQENKGGIPVLEKVGLTFEGLRKQVREKGLQDTLATLTEKFKGNETALRQVIPEIRGLTAVLGTAGAQGEQYKKIVDSISDSMGMLDEAVGETAKTAKDKLAISLNKLKIVGEEIGSKLVPALVSVTTALAKVIQSFTGFNKTEKIIIASTTGLALVLSRLPVAIGLVTGSIKGLTAALATNPFGALAVVVATAGFAIAKYVKHARIAKNMTVELDDKVEELSESFGVLGGEVKKTNENISGFSLARANKELANAKDLLDKFGKGLIELSEDQLKSVNDAIPVLEERIRALSEQQSKSSTIMGAYEVEVDKLNSVIENAKPGEEEMIKRAGTRLSQIKKEIDLLKELVAIRELVSPDISKQKVTGETDDKTIKPSSSIIDTDQLKEEIETASALADGFKITLDNLWEESGSGTEALSAGFYELGTAISTAFNEAAEGEKTLGQAVAGVAKKVIGAFIAEGVASIIKNTLQTTGGFLGPLAIPIASAAGAAAFGLFNSLVPSFAEGGMVSSPTLAMIGDAKDGRPEYVLNSGQMDNLTKGGTLYTEISGRNLRIILDRENSFMGRT